MFKQRFKVGARHTLLSLGLVLGLVQAGCAQPLVVQPSVTMASQMGPVPVYAQIGMPAPMVIMPPPSVVYAPAPRAYGPPVYPVVPAWGGRHAHHGGHGGRGREHGWR